VGVEFERGLKRAFTLAISLLSLSSVDASSEWHQSRSGAQSTRSTWGEVVMSFQPLLSSSLRSRISVAFTKGN